MNIRETYRQKAETMSLPPLPWTWEALGEDRYCEIAVELGYFNPKSERPDYRPSLDPTPFIDLIRKRQTKPKQQE